MTSEERVLDHFLENEKLPDKRYDKPFIITFCGYSGSGKSMASKIFSNVLSCYIIGGDKVRHYMYDREDYSHEFEDIQKVTNYVTDERIKNLLNKHVSVVIDRSVSDEESLNKYKEFGCKVYSIELFSNDEENLKRILKDPKDTFEINPVYGDFDSKSGVKTKEMYDEIKNRKVYNLNTFDYVINTLKPKEEVISDIKETALKIKEKEG